MMFWITVCSLESCMRVPRTITLLSLIHISKEDILSQQGEVLVEKDTLLEKKATDENGQLTFDSDLYHGKYYVKEEVRKPGYLPNEEIWEIDASYTDQNLSLIHI